MVTITRLYLQGKPMWSKFFFFEDKNRKIILILFYSLAGLTMKDSVDFLDKEKCVEYCTDLVQRINLKKNKKRLMPL